MSVLITYAIPGFVALLLLELWLSRATVGGRASQGYKAHDTFASLAMGVGSLITKLPVAAAIYALNTFLYQYRAFDLPEVFWVWGLLFFAEDFCYYWFHRTHHQIRFLWAGHVSHHSSTHYNLSTALRQPWTTYVSGAIFWAPLPLLGFSPEMVLTAQAFSLIYQYWIHTELIGSMGAFGWVFNTPSHHRVHHGRNPMYLDRNHGGVLILWDRIFGSFEPESEPVDFGLTKNIQSWSPLYIAFHEFVAIARDLKGSKKIGHALRYLLAPPGWSPDGSRQTSKEMREEQRSAET